jgi:chemotaxis protein CheX
MTSVLRLPVKCDSAAAELLLEQIKAWRGAPLSIDAQGCSGIGALCASILLSADQTWQADGVEFALINARSLAPDLGLLGLADRLLAMEPVK